MMCRSICIAAVVATACVPNHQDWQDPVPQPLTIGPYVLVTGPDRAIVAFSRASDDKRAITVEWTTAAGERGVQVARRDDGLYSTELAGLPTGPRIDYQIKVGDSLLATGQFRTGRTPGEHFRFITFGDTRTNNRIHREVVEAAAR